MLQKVSDLQSESWLKARPEAPFRWSKEQLNDLLCGQTEWQQKGIRQSRPEDQGVTTAGSGIMGALAGGSCSASNKDMAQERPQVSSSSKAGNFGVSVHRNGPLLFFPLVVREDQWVSTHFIQTQSRTGTKDHYPPPGNSPERSCGTAWHRIKPGNTRAEG